jgi:hypothetical protein
MNKLFKATWGDGYMIKKSEVIPLEIITEENGWWEENIEAIQNSEIGEIVNCSDIGGVLHVERVQ